MDFREEGKVTFKTSSKILYLHGHKEQTRDNTDVFLFVEDKLPGELVSVHGSTVGHKRLPL